ncbi:WD40 repeat domain-containing protein [Tuwongella immobilis]|uniref:Wd-40 repeat-containing protein: WD40 repeat, subgroup n=1 Tax=Tuwongella immobilis TaxID=692036 RepID=A0A6C2YI39_9BACT|nr:hypothetical protein [Tuwongella immobilis]VIP00931.1 wd-40 repeat-containing protein : WD40 repeat, subgroup OS=Calditerrivibrio nitroreducens (strain DSM 19672 / NBRC 101217 / Yu37-1) GN=Calni_0847 PE=4 SV=1 [Tuwongella immobilis]VTR97280.1 wd-40 repeat-containing protein : WD40 repeat, subgroup OS=Calditerrivibrio nitroreducens (strain DSM 19672 / NBRC 101217 / Yu37-1) GN=Calni_0847 PE=4 SV=1 [Tuwongella immobilis]
MTRLLLCQIFVILLGGLRHENLLADQPSRTELKVSPDLGVSKVAISETGGLIAFACEVPVLRDDKRSRTQIRLFKMNDYKLITTIDCPGRLISSLQFTKDARYLLTCDSSGSCIVWNVKDKSKVGTFIGQNGEYSVAVITSDGRYVVINDEHGNCTFWDVATSKKIRELNDRKLACYAMIIKSDDSLVVMAGPSGRVTFIDVKSGRIQKDFDSMLGAIGSIALSPDNTKLLICGVSGTTLLWDIEGNFDIANWSTPKQRPLVCAFRSDGKQVAIGTVSGYIVLLSVDKEAKVVSMTLQSKGLMITGLIYLGTEKSFISCSLTEPNADLWKNWPD